MCFEEGAKKRICCNAVFCDHCYTKDKTCPNCGTTTKQEKLTGATYTLPLYSEHEECRVCLEPGLKRTCCSNYYCDECYYASKACRSCGTPIGDKHVYRLLKGVNVSIILGWAATIFSIVVAVAFTVTIIANEVVTPVTLSGYKCYGFFRTCDLNVCIEMPKTVANGTESFPPLSQWKYCDIDSYAKLEAPACIFDRQLYDATDHMMGYDICVDTFTPGVYVFEDGFENWANETWQSNELKSALWANIVNGHANVYCGACPNGGAKSLAFNGGLEVQQRLAETKDLDLASGGWIEFEMLLAPIGWDVTRPYCKTNYNGDIHVEYSVDEGANWNVIGYYTASAYRSSDFFPIRYEINFNAPKIRFRFTQPSFSVNVDNWALDNVRVFRKQPPGWADQADYQVNMQQTLVEEEYAQCCFDTDWCQTRMSKHKMDQCGQTLPWYTMNEYQMRDAEIVLLIVVFISVLKFLYVSGKDILMRGRFPFHDEFDDLTRTDWIMKHIPARYRPRTLRTNSSVANIHHLARLGGEAKNNLSDVDGVGERIKMKAELEEEKETKRIERMNRLKKKVERREQYLKLSKNRFAVQAANELAKEIETEADEAATEERSTEPRRSIKGDQYGTGIMTTEVDKIKRSEMSMLRIAFDIKVSHERYIFALLLIGVLVVLIIALISVTSFYVVKKTIQAFGLVDSTMSITSFGFNFFALVCDCKEIFWTLKYAVPVKDVSRLDMITVDRSDEVNALFVGPYTIPMQDIYSINNFTREWALVVVCAYFLGAFPWNILSLILRNVYLDFNSMRVVTPIFGGITVLRAILGPGIFVKIAFTCSYFYSWGMKKREMIGIACQAPRTRLAALHGAAIFTGIIILVVSAVAVNFIGEAIAIALVSGAMYGAFTELTYGLPIHPYMQFTTFSEGVYIELKRKEGCPCVYWCSYCTDMHEMQEVFVVYTTHDSRLVDLLKSGNANLY
jgi:hypothetical protein